MFESAKLYSEQRLEESFDAYVLLSEPLNYTLADLADVLSETCGSVAEWQSFKDVESSGEIRATVDRETTRVSVSFSEAALPVDHFEPCVQRATAFPGAKAALQAHQAHVLISAHSGATDLLSRFETARVINCVSAMFARSQSCTAIIFSSGDVIAEPGPWQDAMHTAMQDEWPIDSWISFDIQSFEPEIDWGKPAVMCSSIGLAAFNGHEVTLAATSLAPFEAAQQVFGTINLLLDDDYGLSDGGTIAIEGSDDPLRVRFAEEGHLGVHTNTWVVFHPNATVHENDLFAPTLSVPAPFAIDRLVQPYPGFFSTLLERGLRSRRSLKALMPWYFGS
ncbi:MAG: hypothetical protein JXQ99_12255 [Hyphomicrobiaceae bacterium]